MIQKEKQTRGIEIIKDVLCNKCGISCKEFSSLMAHWGYGSTRDGEVHEAHLCETCWEEIVKDFKHTDLVADNQF
jgi:hypothetical protein